MARPSVPLEHHINHTTNEAMAATQTASTAASAGATVGEKVKAGWHGSSTKEAGQNIADASGEILKGVKAMGSRLKGVAVGAGEGAGGVVGGTVKFADGIVGTAGNMVASVGKIGGKTAAKAPLAALFVAAGTALIVVKGWMSKRDKKQQISELDKQAELTSINIANNATQDHLDGKAPMPTFDNDAATRTDFAAKQAAAKAAAANQQFGRA